MKLISIGYLSNKTVYIGISKEEAMKRYDRDNPDYTIEENSLEVNELEVNDTFYVYDIWN